MMAPLATAPLRCATQAVILWRRTCPTMTDAADQPRDVAGRSFVASIALPVGLAMAVLVFLHLPGMNGPWYWKWPWRRLPVIPYWPLICASAAPVLVAIVLPRKFMAI